MDDERPLEAVKEMGEYSKVSGKQKYYYKEVYGAVQALTSSFWASGFSGHTNPLF